MDILLLNMRIATIIFGLLWLVISLSYYRQGKLKFSTRTIVLCCYFFILVLIAGITSLIRPITVIPRAICIFCLFSAIHVLYIVTSQFIYGQSISLYRNKFFLIFVFSVTIELILLFLGSNNLGSFLDRNESYTLTPIYYLTQVMMFLYPMIVHISMIKALINGIRGKNINNFIRVIFGLLGFCLSFLWWILGLIKINLLVFGISDHQYIDYLMIFARYLVLPMNTPPFIPSLSPWLCKKFSPLYTKLEKKRLYWLTYLHSMTKSIFVSTDKVPEALLNEQRIITELGDLRELLWSHIPHRWSISARTEARYIHQLRLKKQIISDYGDYPPHTARFNSAHYNVKVSKYLYQHEAQ